MSMFNQRLKELRKEKKLKQIDVAKYLDMSLTGYNKYETGVSEPGIDSLIKLSELFNVSIDYLVGKSSQRQSDEATDLFNSLDAADQESLISIAKRFKNK